MLIPTRLQNDIFDFFLLKLHAVVFTCCVDTYEIIQNDIFDYSLVKWQCGCVGMLC